MVRQLRPAMVREGGSLTGDGQVRPGRGLHGIFGLLAQRRLQRGGKLVGVRHQHRHLPPLLIR